MPAKNVVKQYASNQYYHIYSRGVNKELVFKDVQDYGKFLRLLRRYLSRNPEKNPRHGLYPCFNGSVELLAYCLMPNHFHLLVFQSDVRIISDLMRSIMTSYSIYFNKKYNRVGPVHQGRYRASRIINDSYLEHITRYIHLNPEKWETYDYSSLKYYLGNATASWLKPEKILSIFNSSSNYLNFLKDYENHKQMIREIKLQLADN